MKTWMATACAVILLTGCQRDTGASADGASKREAGSAARQMARFRHALLALLPGTYSGGCQAPGHPDSVAIDGAGLLTAPGWKADLLRGTRYLILSRTLPAERYEWRVEASGQAPAGPAAMDGAAAPGLPSDDSGAFRCAYGALGEEHKARRLYPAMAPLFVPAATTLACHEGSSAQSWKIVPTDDGVQVGQRRFSFVDRVETEYIHFDTVAKTLSYSVLYLDGTLLGMSMDGTGRIVSVLTGGGQSSFGCDAPAVAGNG